MINILEWTLARVSAWLRRALGNQGYAVVLLSVCGAAVTGVIAIFSFIYLLQPKLRIRPQGICVTDSAGRCREILEVQSDSSPCLILIDSDKKRRASFCLDSEGAPSLAMNAADGTSRITLETEPDGSPSLVFMGDHAQNRIWLRVERDTSPHLMFWNENKIRAELTAESDGAVNLLLNDASGEARARLGVSPNGLPAARLLDRNGEKIAEWTSGDGESVRLTFTSAAGENLVKLDASPQRGTTMSLNSQHQLTETMLGATDDSAAIEANNRGKKDRWPSQASRP